MAQAALLLFDVYCSTSGSLSLLVLLRMGNWPGSVLVSRFGRGGGTHFRRTGLPSSRIRTGSGADRLHRPIPRRRG